MVCVMLLISKMFLFPLYPIYFIRKYRVFSGLPEAWPSGTGLWFYAKPFTVYANVTKTLMTGTSFLGEDHGL